MNEPRAGGSGGVLTPRRDRRSWRWNLVAVGVALAAGAFLALGPFSTGTTPTSSGGSGGGVTVTAEMSIVEQQGPGVLLVLGLPAVLVALPLLARRARTAHRIRAGVVGVLGVFTILGMLTIGPFFVPTLLALTGALVST